jgi:hypothetical protein
MNISPGYFELSRTPRAKPVLELRRRDSEKKCDSGFSIVDSPDHQITQFLKFPVNSLFSGIKIAETRNPSGFSSARKKIPCYFPCYWGIRVDQRGSCDSASFEDSQLVTGDL